MARGRPDYWYAYLPGKTVFAPNQSQWAQYGSATFNKGAVGVPLDYTVPAETILVITTGYLSIAAPRDYYVYIDIDSVTKMRFYFSSYNILPFNPSGIFEIMEGAQIELKCRGSNHENVTVYAGLIGYEETRAQ